MAKKYFVWADANCNGENIEWVELTFPEFVKVEKDPNRNFITLRDNLFGECDEIHLEVTAKQYKEWKSQDNHENYVTHIEEEFFHYSLDTYVDEEEEISLHDILPNENAHRFVERIENDYSLEQMYMAFSTLSVGEKEFIQTYLSMYVKGSPEREISEFMGIPRTTIRSRKEKIMKKLKKVSSNL